jgi:hypothetical protein
MTRLKIVNPEPNITDRTFPRSLDEVRQRNPLWRELNADDAKAFKGPFDEHGIKHKKDYTWFWLVVWFVTCVFGTMFLIAMLERKDTTIDQKQLDCLSSRGQGAAVIFDDKGSVVDCKRRR